jgi:hypothetical protein
MPQATLEEGFQTSGEDIIKDALPAWVDRSAVSAKLYPNSGRPQWKVGFRCDCRTAKSSVFVKTVDKTIQQVAQSAHDQIAAGHDKCNGATTAAAPPTKREAHLDAELTATNKRQKGMQRKVSAAAEDQGAAAQLRQLTTTQKRLENTAVGRRKEINRNDTDSRLEPTDLHIAVHGKGDPVPKPGGLFHCVTYWARGSIRIVFQLIMALITQFGLEDKTLVVCMHGRKKHNTRVVS